MKTLAFAIGALIAASGAAGLVAPGIFAGIAERVVTPAAFCVVAAVRAAFGLVLIFAAPESAMPRAIRVLGWVLVGVGIATAAAGLFALAQATAAIAWWLGQGPGMVRLAGIPVLIVGGFVAYVCSPLTPD